MADTTDLLVDRARGAVWLLTLNRPAARNALSTPLLGAVAATLAEAEEDEAVRAVVLTGGPDCFAAGADIGELADKDEAAAEADPRVAHWETIRRFAKPLIAAVNGTCLAGGMELALACDLIVAVEEAIFGLPEVKRGLVAGAGGVTRVCQRIGLAPALEIVLTGDPIDAPRALALGLINRVVPRAALLDTAIALAERIAENAPVALRLAKRLAHDVIGASEAEALKLNQEVLDAIRKTEDAMEGPRAFAEKRKPVWKGR